MAVSLPSISISDEAAAMLTAALVNQGYSGTLEEAVETMMINQFKGIIMGYLSNQMQNTHNQQIETETQALVATINAAFAN